jgi:hypothetical protein
MDHLADHVTPRVDTPDCEQISIDAAGPVEAVAYFGCWPDLDQPDGVARAACRDHCTLTACTRGHRIERITIEC